MIFGEPSALPLAVAPTGAAPALEDHHQPLAVNDLRHIEGRKVALQGSDLRCTITVERRPPFIIAQIDRHGTLANGNLTGSQQINLV